ncbi:MAG TPA: 1-acyl-sn-glycerol-3-phosphate acyltransferase [Porticoccaceae bacterium]|nr:1-acyl-sn-glycerol-3-phosphate acyltransferase [Porticoccaceae bacterium]
MSYNNWLFNAIKSAIFYLGLLIIVFLTGIVSGVSYFQSPLKRQKTLSVGNHLIMQWLNLICKIDVQVTGLENIPTGACVILCNHESAWESFYLQWLLQPASFVLKQELMWLPFFGWSLAAMAPIAIDRNKPLSSIRTVLNKGQKRLNRDIRVVIYPEGTRRPHANLGTFKTGGAALAKTAKVPIIPIAHNAGAHWPTNTWIKTPGTIHLIIGKPIETSNQSPRELTDAAKDWIMSAINNNGPKTS